MTGGYLRDKKLKACIDDNSQRKEAEEMGKTMAQVLEERGEARGRVLETIETKQDAIIKLLRLKFEYVPETLIKNVKSINQIDH